MYSHQKHSNFLSPLHFGLQIFYLKKSTGGAIETPQFKSTKFNI